MLVCTINRTHKTTLGGKRLKITGPVRFPDNTEKAKKQESNNVFEGEKKDKESNFMIKNLDTNMDVRMVLKEYFGIPLEETAGITQMDEVPVELIQALD